MRISGTLCGILLFFSFHSISAQQKVVVPELSYTSLPGVWQLHNRDLAYDGTVHLDARPGNGLLILNEPVFSNGQIELDLRAREGDRKSSLGLAFHVVNDSVYDAVFFRPSSFGDPETSGRSVQYISIPGYTWSYLREYHPGQYENTVAPEPEPEAWFHATVDIRYPVVKVFINRAQVPSLVVEKLNSRRDGSVGFWVGDRSGGSFRHLELKPDPD